MPTAPRRKHLLATLIGIASLGLAILGLSWVARRPTRQAEIAPSVSPEIYSPPPPADRPLVGPLDDYVSSQTCRECHAEQFETWHATYHRTMTQQASPTAVLAPFDGVELAAHERTFRLSQQGEQFFVELDDPEAVAGKVRRVTRQVVQTTGSHHYQAYWFATGRSRKLALLPFVYLIGDGRFVPRAAAFLQPPVNDVHFESGRWNHTCIQCHTTGARPRIDGPDFMDTAVAEFGIACEACHGPGEAHVHWHREHADESPRAGDAAAMVDPSQLDHVRSSQVCGQCHSVSAPRTAADREQWKLDGYRYRPGDDLLQSRIIARPLESSQPEFVAQQARNNPHFFAERFWPDGMPRVAGREYNSLVESPCYQRGQLSCLSCHLLHQAADDPRAPSEWANDLLKPAGHGNESCLQCHNELADRLTEHTHHAASSSGSLCYNCHMPYTTYGLLGTTRSHQISSPGAADWSIANRPGACNSCHLDKTLSWTAGRLADWYDQSHTPSEGEDEEIAASLVWLLKGDAGNRALAAWYFGWQPAQQASGTDWMAAMLAQVLDDPYDAVRFIASRSLKSLPGFADFGYDFLDPPKQRQQAQDRVLRQWQQSAPPLREANPNLLIGPNGRLRQNDIERLRRQRDNRRVYLQE